MTNGNLIAVIYSMPVMFGILGYIWYRVKTKTVTKGDIVGGFATIGVVLFIDMILLLFY